MRLHDAPVAEPLAQRGHFPGQRVHPPGIGAGVPVIDTRTLRIGLGKSGGDVQRQLCRHARTDEQMRIGSGMEMMVPMLLFAFFMGLMAFFGVLGLLPVTILGIGQHVRNSRRRIHHEQIAVRLRDRRAEEFLHPEAVDHEHVGVGQLLHVLRCQRIVVRTAQRSRQQQLHLHAFSPLRHVARELIDRKRAAQHVLDRAPTGSGAQGHRDKDHSACFFHQSIFLWEKLYHKCHRPGNPRPMASASFFEKGGNVRTPRRGTGER